MKCLPWVQDSNAEVHLDMGMMLLLEACEKLAEEECTAETKPHATRRSALKRNYAAVDYNEGDVLTSRVVVHSRILLTCHQDTLHQLDICRSQLCDILLHSVQQAMSRPRTRHRRHRPAPSTLPKRHGSLLSDAKALDVQDLQRPCSS
jgi:hypothetical protein